MLHWYKIAQSIDDLTPGRAWLGWKTYESKIRPSDVPHMVMVSLIPSTKELRVSTFRWYQQHWWPTGHAEIIPDAATSARKMNGGITCLNKNSLLSYLHEQLSELSNVRQVTLDNYESELEKMKSERPSDRQF